MVRTQTRLCPADPNDRTAPAEDRSLIIGPRKWKKCERREDKSSKIQFELTQLTQKLTRVSSTRASKEEEEQSCFNLCSEVAGTSEQLGVARPSFTSVCFLLYLYLHEISHGLSFTSLNNTVSISSSKIVDIWNEWVLFFLGFHIIICQNLLFVSDMLIRSTCVKRKGKCKQGFYSECSQLASQTNVAEFM